MGVNWIGTTWITWDSLKSQLSQKNHTIFETRVCQIAWLTRDISDDLIFFCPQTSELGVTEHVEGDPCKFALWVGRTPTNDNKIVLKVKHTPSHLLLLKSPLGFDRYGFTKPTPEIPGDWKC